MSRVALSTSKVGVIAVVVAVFAVGGGVWVYVANLPSHKVHTVLNAENQLTEISYQGQDSVDALTLLKQHATVQLKHYSFGDMVVSINGVPGTGPKYWSFYVNGKLSQVGAGSYVTKATDTLDWKLQ